MANVTPLGPMSRQVLTHLMQVGNVSGVEASALYKCRDLPKRISEIKASGYKIEREMKRDVSGQRYARYTLKKRRAAKTS